jgi:hypothetical protein
VRDKKPGTIFLHAVWNEHDETQMLNSLGHTLRYIKTASPDSKVFLIGPVPQWKPTLPDYALRKHVSLARETYLKMPMYQKLRALDIKIQRLSMENKISYISPLTRMCKNDECLVVGKVNGKLALTAVDYGHLSEEGADILAEYIFSFKH